MKRAFLALALLAGAAQAAQTPVPGSVDPHIQTVLYDPDQVIRLRGHVGYQMMVEFEPGERIENVAIGDALGWQVTPNKRANRLFVKPVDRKTVTNMTVVTDRRQYTFALNTAAPGVSMAKAPWVVRFIYPAPPAVQVVVAPPPPPDPVLNFSYQMKGAKQLLPVRVFDDGRETYFEWPQGTPAPAIFAVGPDRRESLVNYAVRDRYTVVQRLSGSFILRSGKAKATITRAAPEAVDDKKNGNRDATNLASRAGGRS